MRQRGEQIRARLHVRHTAATGLENANTDRNGLISCPVAFLALAICIALTQLEASPDGLRSCLPVLIVESDGRSLVDRTRIHARATLGARAELARMAGYGRRAGENELQTANR